MIGEPFDLEARIAISQRCDHAVRVSVARYCLLLSNVLGRACAPEPSFPLYYPGMPAYDAARATRTMKAEGGD